jgi:hypothetical protein
VLTAHLRPHARALLEAPDAFVEVARPEDEVIDVGPGRRGSGGAAWTIAPQARPSRDSKRVFMPKRYNADRRNPS